MSVRRSIRCLLLLALLTLASANLVGARPPEPDAPAEPAGPLATCTNSHTADGVPIDQCYPQTFTIGANTRSVSVFFTLSHAHDGTPHNHGIDNLGEAQDVADWAQEAWERYHADSGVEPYITGCGGNIDLVLREGDGWSGIAWWASSGSCSIGIDAPMVRDGDARHTTLHEVQHYEQYGFDDCYDDWRGDYDVNAEFVEGYADYGPSTVDNAGWYDSSAYDASENMYAKSYGNRFVIYLSEQVSGGLGPNGSPGDAWYRSNGMYEHYRECEDQDDLYVERDIVEDNTPYSYEEFFLNFLSANWASEWADESTQPELHYYEEDVGIDLAAPTLAADLTMSGGAMNWPGQMVPDRWAGAYYQVRPQSGCPYLMWSVNGEPAATLGISFMAADTSAPSVVRSAWVGEDFERVFPAYGVYDRLVAAIGTFIYTYDFDLTAICVNPTIELLEPKQTNFVLVGEPSSPIAFIARFRVASGSLPVHGLTESSFSFDAAGDAVSVVPGTLFEIGAGEYWATLLPPAKPAGTTFVDFQACVDGAVCDTELDALLYVLPGNSDTIILHDESGSMSTEDVIGEGSRLVNSQKAAMVWANLAREGDRYGVMGFNALNDPPNCDFPGGTGYCTMDIRTHMARTEITSPTAEIPTIEAAISSTQALNFTPLGQGLLDAKDALLASPASDNPKSIILLSDGLENVQPLYSLLGSGVQDDMIDSGVVVNTIGFSGDSSSALLSQIAVDTGGLFRHVPTDPGSSLAPSARAAARETYAGRLVAQGVPEALARELAAELMPSSTYYPANVGLADVYDLFETDAQDAVRVKGTIHTDVPSNTWRTVTFNVDPSVNTLRLVSAGRQLDIEVDDLNGCDAYHRKVEVLPPPGTGEWIPVSPVEFGLLPPASWDIRNSTFVDVAVIPNPDAGQWKVRTKVTAQL